MEGVEQTVRLRWSAFRAFLETCRQPDGPKDFKAISLDVSRRPRLVFDGNQANLRAAIGNAQVRHKLGKALMTNFDWPDADEIHLYNDFTPYSFFFREFRGEKSCLCGGLILHGQEDMSPTPSTRSKPRPVSQVNSNVIRSRRLSSQSRAKEWISLVMMQPSRWRRSSSS